MRGVVLVALTMAALSGCRRGKAVPQASPSASSSASASALPEPPAPPAGVPRWSEPALAAWFPREHGALSLDANADLRGFGESGESPLRAGCELVSVHCEELERLGLRRVVRVPYSDRAGARARVAVTLLRFDAAESAYAAFTKRLAEAAEAGKPAFTTLVVPGQGVLGDTNAVVVRAESLLELVFSDERLSPERSVLRSKELLPGLSRAIAERLPGGTRLPLAAELLPERGQKPLSVRYDRFDLFEISGVGPGAHATYIDVEPSYEIAVLERADEDAAEDVLETLRRLPAARVLKNAPYRATRVILNDERTGRRVAWIFGQRGGVILGVGAELEPEARPRRHVPERDPVLYRMKRLLDGIRR